MAFYLPFGLAVLALIIGTGGTAWACFIINHPQRHWRYRWGYSSLLAVSTIAAVLALIIASVLTFMEAANQLFL